MLLFLCHFALKPSPPASAAYTTKVPPAAQVPSFSTEKLAQGTEYFSSSVWRLLHSTGLFLSAWYRFLRKETEGARKQHDSRKQEGKRERNTFPWVLSDDDLSQQGWLTEEYICSWPVKHRFFWEHKQLNEQEQSHLTDPRATADLSGQCSCSQESDGSSPTDRQLTALPRCPIGSTARKKRPSIKGKKNNKPFGHECMLTLVLEKCKMSKQKIPFSFKLLMYHHITLWNAVIS